MRFSWLHCPCLHQSIPLPTLTRPECFSQSQTQASRKPTWIPAGVVDSRSLEECALNQWLFRRNSSWPLDTDTGHMAETLQPAQTCLSLDSRACAIRHCSYASHHESCVKRGCGKQQHSDPQQLGLSGATAHRTVCQPSHCDLQAAYSSIWAWHWSAAVAVTCGVPALETQWLEWCRHRKVTEARWWKIDSGLSSYI